MMQSDGTHDPGQALRTALMLLRADIFGSDDQLPLSEPGDAAIPQPGYVGRGYARGGDLLLAINPGGGGASYRRTAADARLLPMIQAFRRGEDVAIEEIARQYLGNMRDWPLWRIVRPVLDACHRSEHDVAYANWCPFRTRDDRMPRAEAMRRCRDAHVLPTIRLLAPKRIIALGKKAGGWLQRLDLPDSRTFVVQRTNGDRWVCPEARETLGRIRMSSEEILT
jgi:hypothetical protein